jgi:hypothetical protein
VRRPPHGGKVTPATPTRQPAVQTSIGVAVVLLGLTMWELWPEDQWSPSPAA